MKKLAFLAWLLPLWGCSPRTMALRSTVSLLDRGAGALYDEPDPVFAREAMASQLKLLEELLRNEPKNRKLLRLSAEGFGGYAFLFLEDSQPERAKGFYLRGRDYARRALDSREDDLPALFWAAFNWAGWINLSKDSPDAVADLPQAVALMRKVEEKDPGFHFAGPELFFGVYYASRPAMLGGDINKAKAHFERARTLTGGKFLMAYVLEARYYAVGAQDKELFQSLLAKVKDAPAGELPEARLADEAAKLKAAALLERIDDLF